MAVIALEVFEDGVFEDGVYADFTSDYVSRLDIINKIIFIKASVVTFHPVSDVYSEVRSIRRVDESVRKMDNPVSSQGNEPAGSNFTPRRAVLNSGWRLGIEFTTNWTLSISGEMISDDGFAGAQLVKLDYMPEGVSALINYTPPSSEVVTVETTTAVVTGDLASVEAKIDAIPDDVWTSTPATDLITDIQFIKAVEGGRWKLAGTEMIFYKEDNITEIARYSMRDGSGVPTTANPVERVRI